MPLSGLAAGTGLIILNNRLSHPCTLNHLLAASNRSNNDFVSVAYNNFETGLNRYFRISKAEAEEYGHQRNMQMFMHIIRMSVFLEFSELSYRHTYYRCKD